MSSSIDYTHLAPIPHQGRLTDEIDFAGRGRPRFGHQDSSTDVHTEDDISLQTMQHNDTTRRSSEESPGNERGEYGLVGSPETYGENFAMDAALLGKQGSKPFGGKPYGGKPYDYHESRKMLFRTGFTRFFITFLFCVIIGLSLKTYEGYSKPRILSNQSVRFFNALLLGLSLGLGLNLASSLKRYAVILRWSILTKRFVSLETFDLILGCETLTKVGKLMIISIPGIPKVPYLRALPWFREARGDGSRTTWIICMLWLLINIGAQILVAALSLFWPVDPSQSIPLLTHGNVSVADLATWRVNPPVANSNASFLAAANAYGIQAEDFTIMPATVSETNVSANSRSVLYEADNYMEYRFLDRNPDNMYDNYLVSGRTIRANATCVRLNIQQDWVWIDDLFYVNASYNGKDWFLFDLPEYVTGSISWVGSRASHCGPRCTNVTVYQTADNNLIKNSAMFQCNSTLSPVLESKSDFTNLNTGDHDHIYSTNDFARIGAGAITWTGYTMNMRDDVQTRVYLYGLPWSPYEMVSTDEIENLLQRFTIGAIAAHDDHGPNYIVRNQNTRPVQGQQLHVDWSYVLSIMGGICAIQLVSLICLLVFANKSIIRDESFWSMAMLLSPVVNRIGKEGMNLSGEDIKKHERLRGEKIRYDYREGKNGEANQVDIFFEGRDKGPVRRSWASGVFV